MAENVQISDRRRAEPGREVSLVVENMSEMLRRRRLCILQKAMKKLFPQRNFFPTERISLTSHGLSKCLAGEPSVSCLGAVRVCALCLASRSHFAGGRTRHVYNARGVGATARVCVTCVIGDDSSHVSCALAEQVSEPEPVTRTRGGATAPA